MFFSWFSIVLIGLQFSVQFTAGRLQDDWKDYIDPEILERDIGKDHSERFGPVSFEGDIDGLLEDRDISQLKSLSKNVLKDKETRWTNGIVPYRFKPNLFSAQKEAFVKRSMREISLMTRNCIRFVERTDEEDYIFFTLSIGCSSNIGKQGSGAQIVRLHAGCMAHMGDIQHELMHVLGFYHEMSRTDRDQFVTINWENIGEENKDQFKMYTDGDTFGLPYDYESVMQYPFNAFARNSATPTIVPKQKHARIGQSKNLSPLDVLKIQKAYSCDSIPDPTSGDIAAIPVGEITAATVVIKTVAVHVAGRSATSLSSNESNDLFINNTISRVSLSLFHDIDSALLKVPEKAAEVEQPHLQSQHNTTTNILDEDVSEKALIDLHEEVNNKQQNYTDLMNLVQNAPNHSPVALVPSRCSAVPSPGIADNVRPTTGNRPLSMSQSWSTSAPSRSVFYGNPSTNGTLPGKLLETLSGTLPSSSPRPALPPPHSTLPLNWGLSWRMPVSSLANRILTSNGIVRNENGFVAHGTSPQAYNSNQLQEKRFTWRNFE